MLCKSANLRTGYVLQFQGTVCDKDQFWVLYLIENLRRKLKRTENLVTAEQVLHMSDQQTRQRGVYKIATYMKLLMLVRLIGWGRGI